MDYSGMEFPIDNKLKVCLHKLEFAIKCYVTCQSEMYEKPWAPRAREKILHFKLCRVT